jgi:hypothetical protein
MPRLTRPALAIGLLVIACGDPTGTTLYPHSGEPSAARAPSPPAPLVITTIYDADTMGNALLTRSDDSNGTGFATYTASSKITSQIASTGAWKLFLGNQSARTIYLVLGSQGIPAPDGYYSASVEVYSQCFDASGNAVGLLKMTAGSSNGDCAFGKDFSYGRTKYKLVMSPKFDGTGRALVTCNADIAGSCTSWSITVNPSVANAGVATLFRFANNGDLVFVGIYHDSYAIAATIQ